MIRSNIRSIPLIVLLLLAVIGCNEQVRTDDRYASPSVQKEKDVIARLLIDLKEAFASLDIDKMMTFYSEDYQGSRGENKQEVRELIEWMIKDKKISGNEMYIDQADISINENVATVTPIEYRSMVGTLKIENTLKKINGKWKLTKGRHAY